MTRVRLERDYAAKKQYSENENVAHSLCAILP